MSRTVKKLKEILAITLLFIIGIGAISLVFGVLLTPFALLFGFTEVVNTIFIVSSILINVSLLLLLIALFLNVDE